MIFVARVAAVPREHASRLPVWRKGSARALDVTVQSHSGHPARGCIPRHRASMPVDSQFNRTWYAREVWVQFWVRVQFVVHSSFEGGGVGLWQRLIDAPDAADARLLLMLGATTYRVVRYFGDTAPCRKTGVTLHSHLRTFRLCIAPAGHILFDSGFCPSPVWPMYARRVSSSFWWCLHCPGDGSSPRTQGRPACAWAALART